ncbi:MAG: hypothetical protein ACK51Q_00610 [Betaproteobacteria bacterium]|jgi:hypothetical protein
MEHHFNDGTEPTILPHYARCAGPCQQGRALCPCPESCEAALDESSLRMAGKAFLAVVLAGVVIAVGVALI